jgi:outer membrane protein assembly factor BamA
MALLIPSGAGAPRAPAYSGYRIENIYILKRQIFDTSIPSEDKLVYRAINHLHFLTKDRTIRQQLLFKEGDLFNPDIAQESERALRKILRLKDVHVRAVPVGPGKVDVLVESQDTWTTEPFIGISGSGAETKYTMGIRERNLGGYGKEVGFLYKKEPELVTRNFSYDDPAVLGSRLRLSGDYADTSEGSSRSLSIEKPFSSSLTRYGFKTAGSYDRHESVLYENGQEVRRFNSEIRDLGGTIAFSVGSTVRKIQRLGFGYQYLHEKLAEPTNSDPLITDENYHLFGPTVQWEKIHFITANHIRLYSRVEDYNMGPSLTARVGLSQSRWVREAENATAIEGQYIHGHLWGPDRFGLATLKGNGRYENGWKNTETRLDLEYYNRGKYWSTWAGHVAWDQVLHPDQDTQLLLGGTSGLRGYPVNSFAGNRLFQANFENRLFLVDEVFEFFGIGAVGFVDAGYVWPPGTAPVLGDLRVGYGAGLRFHLSRASLGQVLRFDIAWPTRSTQGSRSPVFTFGTGQVF